MPIIHEEWRPVVGFEGQHEVSDSGRVKTLSHVFSDRLGRRVTKPEKIASQSKHSRGYAVVALRDGRTHYVHRLVMAAFVGPANSGDQVNHINGDKSDNRLGNLEYCNSAGNIRHAIATGLQDNAGESNPMSRFTSEQIVHAYESFRDGCSYSEAAAKSGVSVAALQSVIYGIRWKHLGLKPLGKNQ